MKYLIVLTLFLAACTGERSTDTATSGCLINNSDGECSIYWRIGE